MNVILINTRENAQEKVEGMSKEMRNKDKTFDLFTSSNDPCMYWLGGTQTQVYFSCNF